MYVRRRGYVSGPAERYGGVLVYDKYPLDPDADGRGETSRAPVTAPQFAGPPKNDTAAQMEYLAAQQPK